ncbi:hypothetical protein TNCV_3093171 [Trichonephila clavipes]|nr:hypothetical protein TNCV_3093171 [Trichonephila clavipes]
MHQKVILTYYTSRYKLLLTIHNTKIANYLITENCKLQPIEEIDQIKRRVPLESEPPPQEVRHYFIDDWSEWVSPSELADKSSFDGRFNRFNQAGSTSSLNRNDKLKTDDKSERPPVSCYGCVYLSKERNCSSSSPSLFGSSIPSSSSNMDISVPPGTPYQKQVSTCSTLPPKRPFLSFKDCGSSPVTSQTINHDVNRHPLNTSTRQQTSKFMPLTDYPCVILSQPSPTTFEVANVEDPDFPIWLYHTSALRPHQGSSKPLTPFRKRGRQERLFHAPRRGVVRTRGGDCIYNCNR